MQQWYTIVNITEYFFNMLLTSEQVIFPYVGSTIVYQTAI